MGQRLDFHAILKGICPNVYFQPPENIKMVYPCIVYHRDYRLMKYANNFPYWGKKRYLVTVMDTDPDSTLPEQVAALPMSSFDRFFTKDQLNHDVYQIFF